MSEISERFKQVPVDASAIPNKYLDRMLKRNYQFGDIPQQLQHVVWERNHPQNLAAVDFMVNTFIADMVAVFSEPGDELSPETAQGLVTLSFNRSFLAGK